MQEIKWVKLYTNFFDNRKVAFIQNLPNGNEIILLWLKLLTLGGSINDGGKVYVSEDIEYTEESLAAATKLPHNTVKLGIEVLKKVGLLEKDGLQIAKWEEYQNVDGMEKIREQNRRRQKEHYERKKLRERKALELPNTELEQSKPNVRPHVRITQPHATDIDKEIDIDIDLDIEKKETKEQTYAPASKKSSNKLTKTAYAEYVSMLDAEYQKLATEHGEPATKWMIEKLDNYKGSTGKKYKDDYRAILSWVVKAYKEETNNGKTLKRDIDYITDPAGSGAPDFSFADLERIDREHWAAENAKKRN